MQRSLLLFLTLCIEWRSDRWHVFTSFVALILKWRILAAYLLTCPTAMNACGESKHTTCQQPQFALCLGIWCNKSIPIVEKKKEIWGRRPAVCREMFLQALGVEEIRVGYRRTLAAGDNAECIHQQSETQTWINASNAKTVWSTMQLFISSSSVEWNSKFWIRGWQVYPGTLSCGFIFFFSISDLLFFFFPAEKSW